MAVRTAVGTKAPEERNMPFLGNKKSNVVNEENGKGLGKYFILNTMGSCFKWERK